jgi:catechol 2,3-dioxygenase-like lactoylglutathione lyase family enzyme
MRPRRVLETALYCGNLTDTARFYYQLGFTAMLESTRLVVLDAGEGTVLLLFQRGGTVDGLATSGGFVPPHDGYGPQHVAFAVDAATLGAWEDRLAALGIAIESRVRWSGGGVSLYFRDPDGHSIELATPGTWPTW